MMVDCPACAGTGEIVVGAVDPQLVEAATCAWCGGASQVTEESAAAYAERAADSDA